MVVSWFKIDVAFFSESMNNYALLMISTKAEKLKKKVRKRFFSNAIFTPRLFYKVVHFKNRNTLCAVFK